MILKKKYPNLIKLGGLTGNLTTSFNGKTREEAKHPGIDVANKNGTPIPSMSDGVVTNVVTGRKNGDNNFGNQVSIKDNQGNTITYSHLKDVMARPGQQIKEGQVIMRMGDTGASYSPKGGDSSHVDIRIVDAYNRYRDPLKFKKQKQWRA